MNQKLHRKRLGFILMGALILVGGLAGAAVIYYQALNSTSAATELENSKMYTHNLEVYGGKFNVILDDFRRWFVGLWEGKSLAVIIAIITIMVALGFFFAAHSLTQGNGYDVNPENHRNEAG